MPGHAWRAWETCVYDGNSQECWGIIHQFHHHHHKQFCTEVCTNYILRWDPFLIFQTCSSGLWSSWRSPQFLSSFGLFLLSRVPWETRSMDPFPATSCFFLSLVLGAFHFRLFWFTNHQYTVSFLISRKKATFSISSSVGLLHILW